MDDFSHAILTLVLVLTIGGTAALLPASSKERSPYWNRAINNLPNGIIIPIGLNYLMLLHVVHFVCLSVCSVYGCPRLADPKNGDVTVKGNKATYTCDDEYSLVGRSERTCFCAKWFGISPVCVASKQIYTLNIGSNLH